jgi:hypothetical protein
VALDRLQQQRPRLHLLPRQLPGLRLEVQQRQQAR